MEEGGGGISSGQLSSIMNSGAGSGAGMEGGNEGGVLSMPVGGATPAFNFVNEVISGPIGKKLEDIGDQFAESTMGKTLTMGLNTLTNASISKFLPPTGLAISSLINAQGLGLGQFISPPTPIAPMQGKQQSK